jgi:hypothetical protein
LQFLDDLLSLCGIGFVGVQFLGGFQFEFDGGFESLYVAVFCALGDFDELVKVVDFLWHFALVIGGGFFILCGRCVRL